MHPNYDIHAEPMREADIPQVYALERVCFTAPWDIESYYSELENQFACYQVVKLDDAVVGFGGMWVIGEEAHIATLAVALAHRQHGLGRRLVQALLAECRRRGVQRVTLEVRVSNRPAQELYKSLGFRTVGRRRAYYPDNREDALVMALEGVKG